MFNTYQVGPRSIDITAHSEVKEFRAPTDESVRLLREMEQKAQDSILLAIRCDSNLFKFKAIVFERHDLNEVHLRIQFTLGEVPHDHQITLPDSWRAKSRDEWILKIRDEIAQRIANDIIINLCSDDVLRRKLSAFQS